MKESASKEDLLAQKARKVNLRQTSILIVDSNEFSRSFIRSICRNLHFGNILTAANTTEALNVLGGNFVHLLVCDWELMPLDPVGFIKQVRRSPPNDTVPVVVLTSVGSADAILAARDAGVDDYLTRPIVMRRLLNSFVSSLCIPRVFVKATTYVGPCRRRQKRAAVYSGPERRRGIKSPARITTLSHAEQGPTPTGGSKSSQLLANPLPLEGSAFGGETSLEEMEKLGEAAIAQQADAYNKVRLDDINEIYNFVRALKEPNASLKDVLEGLYKKVLDIKGMGDTFGFPLLTRVGELLCIYIRATPPQSFTQLATLQVVEAHAIIMKMIIDSNMRDENDDLAKEVLGELYSMVNGVPPKA